MSPKTMSPNTMSPNTAVERGAPYSPQPPVSDRLRVDGRRAKRPDGLLERLRVRWRSLELDHALARGASPQGSPELALRADQLSRDRTRLEFADEIDELVALAGHPEDAAADADPEGPGATFRTSRRLFGEIADRLRGPGPHSLRGLAMTSVLLRDRGGPLYADSIRLDDARGPLHANGGSLVLLQAMRQIQAALDA
jgi:hypothetical protein